MGKQKEEKIVFDDNFTTVRKEIVEFVLQRMDYYGSVDGNKEEVRSAERKKFFLMNIARLLGATDSDIYH